MMDDGTAMMNDNDRLFDWRLDRFKSVWRDRRRLRDAGQHAESQGSGDNVVSDDFVIKRHFKSPVPAPDNAPAPRPIGTTRNRNQFPVRSQPTWREPYFTPSSASMMAPEMAVPNTPARFGPMA